jgi:hypothetical protein
VARQKGVSGWVGCGQQAITAPCYTSQQGADKHCKASLKELAGLSARQAQARKQTGGMPNTQHSSSQHSMAQHVTACPSTVHRLTIQPTGLLV